MILQLGQVPRSAKNRTFVDAEGDRWNTMDNGSLELDRLAGNPSDFNADEYGDRTYMWEYR